MNSLYTHRHHQLSTWLRPSLPLGIIIALTLMYLGMMPAVTGAQLDVDRVEGQAIFTHSLQAPYTHDEFSNE